VSDTVPRLRPGDLLRIRSERWRVTTLASFGGTAIVEVAGIDPENRGRRSRFVLPFEPVEMLPVSATPRVVRPARWRRAARSILADALPAPTSLRTAARADFGLLPFQLEPALAITRGLGTRVLIADAVGLGKTVQAALIVCPAGLREQWQQELETRFGLAAAVLDSGVLATRGAAAFVNPWTTEAIGVTSIDFIKRAEVLRALEEMVWDVVVFDEAHALSGRSDRTAAGAVSVRAR
jgi:hypothetical protein